MRKARRADDRVARTATSGEIEDLHGILPLQDDLAVVQPQKNHRQNHARDGPGRRGPGVWVQVHIENMTRTGVERREVP